MRSMKRMVLMASALAATAAMAATVALSCGGKAVLDAGQGEGGSTSDGSGSGASGTSNGMPAGPGSGPGSGPGNGSTASGPMPSCAELGEELRAAIVEAQACDTCDDGPDPCNYFSGIELTDDCGCPAPLNFNNEPAVEAAVDAFNTWDAQCEVLPCGEPCGVASDPTCNANGPGCSGTCALGF